MADKTTQYFKFSTNLWDGFDALCRHTANEIQFCKDVLKFMKKRSQIEEEYARSLSKLAQKSQYTTPLGTVSRTWEDLLTETQSTADVHGNVVSQLGEKVVEAFQVLIKDLETTRKTLVNDGTALNNEYASNVDAYKKSKANYEKCSKEAEIAQKTYEVAKTDGITKPKDLQRLEKDAEKKAQMAQAADDAYKKRIEDTNNFLEQYYTDRMPRILNDFEHLETVRIHMLKSNLRKYNQVLDIAPPNLVKQLQLLQASVDQINNDADIEQFVRQNKSGEVIPEPFEYEPYVQGKVEAKKNMNFGATRFMRHLANAIPTSVTTLPVNSQAPTPAAASPAAAAPRKPANAIFGVPLEKLMEKQKETYPDLEVPRIVNALIDAIYRLDGTKSEGIFRVPAGANELKTLKDRLDDGDYDVLTQTDNVHLPCAALKLWLREVPEIIPSSYYETCIETPEKSLEILSQLPIANQHLIAAVIHFLQDLAKPEYVERTKMNKDNLSMVFAPSFLHCPYTDYNKVLLASEKEKHFVNFLCDRLLPKQQQAAASPPPAAVAPPTDPNSDPLSDGSVTVTQVPLVRSGSSNNGLTSSGSASSPEPRIGGQRGLMLGANRAPRYSVRMTDSQP